MTAPGLPNYADYEFVFSAPDGRSGVMPGIELHRMILDALDSSRAALVESIAAGFDARATEARNITRFMPGLRDIDVVLAWQSAARYVRTHAAGRPTAAAAAVSSPTGTPGARCPSRIAHESGAVLGCRREPHGPERNHWMPPVSWRDDDDRVITGYGPATSPTGDPTP